MIDWAIDATKEAPAIRACGVEREPNEIRMTSTAPAAGGTGHPSAKRAFSRRVVALLAAAGLGGWLAAPAQGQSNDASATYTVTFQGEWTLSSTPGGVVGSAHFTTLIGAVHNRDVTFWSSGGTATPGIEAVAELGSTGTFRSEINARGTDVASVIQQSVGFGGRGSATFEIDVTTDHPLVTLVSMIGPSPDWFVGVSRLSLLSGGQWRSRHSVNLYPYDAGTEDGEEFSLSNPATSPQGTITSIRGTGKFSNEPMATLSFVRKDAPPPPPTRRISVADARASEGEPVTFTVRLAGGTLGSDLRLSATPGSEPGDTATADTDYVTAPRDVTIAAGRTTATFSVATVDDRDDEPDETFTVTLSARSGTTLPAGVTFTGRTATGTIMDDDVAGAVRHIPLFLPASDPLGRQSFARITNYSDEDGAVRVDAFDDEGSPYGPLTLSIDANETVHINSGDLEDGNPDKGLDGATGPGVGRWRLELASPLDLEVLAYVRTEDGFVTSMHDVVPHTGDGHHVAFFNPGRNASQVSRLRLINRGAETAEVVIEGFDGGGVSPGTEVRLSVPARGARTLTARELESAEGRGEAAQDLDGALGEGAGKWRLVVTSDRPIEVMSLLASPTGHLTNLSTAPGRMEPAPVQ